MSRAAVQPPPTGPVKVETSDGSGFDLWFPWELNNTDYLRRILCHVTFALQKVGRVALLLALMFLTSGQARFK